MNRLASNFRLKPKTDANGKVTIKSDNIAVGLMVCLMGLFCAGIFIAMFVGLGDPAKWYDLHRKPFDFESSEINQSIEEMNRMNKELGLDVQPLKPMPHVSRHEPGGFDWQAFGLLLMNHVFIVGGMIAGFVGIRIMFTGTTVSFDKREARIKWEYAGFRCASSIEYKLSQVALVLHETVVRNPRGFDWHGFAATLVNKDNIVIQLARSKKIETLKQYGEDLHRLTGIEVKDIGAEQSNGALQLFADAKS